MAVVRQPQETHQRSSPAVIEAVDEMMRIYRSLSQRPSIDESEAAESVIRAADAEEEKRLEEILVTEKHPDLPEELFNILQDVRRSAVKLLAEEQRREGRRILDLDRRFCFLDELIQRASIIVSPDGSCSSDVEPRVRLRPVEAGPEKKGRISGLNLLKGKDMEPPVRFGSVEVGPGKKGRISDSSLLKGKEEKFSSFEVPKTLTRTSSLKSGRAAVFADEGAEKLTLIKLAGLIEASAKSEAKVLNLQGKLMDQIEWLPLSVGKLTNITELNLSENQIMALPSNIANLRSLMKLDLHSNKLVNLPDNIGELTSLLELDLRANSLKSLPQSLGNLSSLVSLDLSSNQLSVLPDSLGNLTKLKTLNAETNELEELPYTIGSCTSLMELRLDFNQLRALPEAMGKLQSLQVLTLHYNRIKGMPTTMASLSELRELDVSFNELESIPESLCFATNLVKLRVGNNFADLTALPRSIGNLEMLEELDISNDQIRVLPSSFRLLSKLRVFLAEGTPLDVPPRDVVNLGAEAVVKYMADLAEPMKAAAAAAPPRAEERKSFCAWLCSFFTSPRDNYEPKIDT